jgi:hypothetical protein
MEALGPRHRGVFQERGFHGGDMDEGSTRGYAGAAEFAEDFLVSVGRVQQAGGAVEKGHERKSERGVTIGSAAKLSGEAALDEFEGGHGLFASEGDGPVFGDEAEVVGMGGEKIEGAAASFHGRARRANGGKKIAAGAAAEKSEKITLVREALVESRSGGAGGAGDGAHGEGVFAMFTPDTVGGVENAAFQTGISNTRHGATFRGKLVPNYILYNVKPTMYK